MKKNSIVLATLLMCTGSALAGTGTSSAISTQELAGVCGDQSNPQPQIYCDVYGQGVYDGYLVTRHPKLAPDFICVVQPALARRVVMNQFIDWVKQNPIYNTAPAADTLLRFLAIQFPCDTNESSPGKAVKKITN